MFSKSFKSAKAMHKNESGQAALETAIILIAFVVVASVFAFAILSAGSASTDKGKQAINAGLQGVQSSMSIKGGVTAKGSATAVTDVIVDLALVAGGSPVDLTPPGTTKANVTVVNYRDATQSVPNIPWTVTYIGKKSSAANLLQDGDLAEMDIVLTANITTALGPNTAFTIEIVPQTGSVIKIDRTTPAAISAVMNLN